MADAVVPVAVSVRIWCAWSVKPGLSFAPVVRCWILASFGVVESCNDVAVWYPMWVAHRFAFGHLCLRGLTCVIV